MTGYELAALDIAGTTVDEGGLVYAAIQAAVEGDVGQPISSGLMSRWKGTSKEEAIAGLLADLDADPSPAHVATIFRDFTERLEASYATMPPSPIPGVEGLFEKLHLADVKVALQTGYSAPVTTSILNGLGWSVGDTIDAVVTSDLVAASRPAPYLIFHAMEATGISDVRRVLTAGDTPNDLAAGMNAGVRYVLGVTTGSFDRAQLEAHPHTHIVDSVVDALTLL